MAFTIPNVGEAGFSPQAMLNRVDMDILAGGFGRNGVSTGCAVTTTGTGNGSVTVAAGTAVISGIYRTVVAGNVTLSANSSGQPRLDLITVDTAGTKSSVVGTPAATPLLPSIPSDRTVFAAVYVPNGHGGGSTIAANQIIDKRIIVGASDFQAHNILEYGAIGDSHHNSGGGTDDTAAIQAAYTAAQQAGGFGVVVWPGNRSYGITDTIECQPDQNKGAVWTWGVGSLGGNQVVQLPNVVWNGAAGGTMLNSEASGSNLFGSLFRNIRFAGRDIAATAIRYGPSAAQILKIDSGSGLDEVHIGAVTGNAIQCDGIGATNFWIRGGRWDRIGGYALYMNIGSQTFVTIRDVTWDGHSVANSCNGFAWFDAGAHALEGTNNTHYIMCHMDGIHWESDNLAETIAGATEEAGKRGVIRCTIESAETIVQHKLTFTNCQNLGWSGSSASHSLVQMDGGASNAERKARLNVSARNIFGFNGDGSSATGHAILLGNCGLTNPDPGGEYQEWTHRFSGGGVGAASYPRVWNNTG